MSDSDLGYDRYVSELVAETDRFAEAVHALPTGTPVPTCPGWTVGSLVEHIGQSQRWARQIVVRRASAEVPVTDLEDAEVPDGAEELSLWLRTGARRLAAAVAEAGPHTPVWTWSEPHEAGFWARRMLHDVLMHRADAALAGGLLFTADPDLAADNISEWLGLLSQPALASFAPRTAELRGGGEVLRLHAIDEGLGVGGQWLIRREAGGVCWEHASGEAAVSLRGKAVDLMLVMNRRAAPGDRDVELTGDAELLTHWLERSGFG